jgi:hypothetical protein
MQRFTTAWATTGFPAVYPDVPLSAAMETAIKTGTNPWARINIRHNIRDQRSLAGEAGTRYEAQGVVIIEIYTLKGGACTQAYTLARQVEQAYEGVSTPNGVWFRKVRTVEIGDDGNFYHVNVTLEFIYDD